MNSMLIPAPTAYNKPALAALSTNANPFLEPVRRH